MWIMDILKYRFNKKVETSDAMKRLAELNNELDLIDNVVITHTKLMRNVTDSIDSAIWAKNLDNRFVYANKKCCDDLLHCSEAEVVMATDSDLADNTLAIACNTSDNAVILSGDPMRFIEHNGKWWDTLKSPLYSGEDIIGTIGVAKEITHIIPDKIIDQHIPAGATVIPIDTTICEGTISELMIQ